MVTHAHNLSTQTTGRIAKGARAAKSETLSQANKQNSGKSFMRAFPKILELTFWSRSLQALCTCFHAVHTDLQSYYCVWFLVSF